MRQRHVLISNAWRLGCHFGVAEAAATTEWASWAWTAKDVEEVLHDGVLNAKKQKSHARPGEAETQLEEHCKRITKIVQTCNVSMRWLLLNVFTEHSHSKAVRACVGGVADAARDIVKALLRMTMLSRRYLHSG